MVKNIVELFHKIAEKHTLIRSFRYDTLSKGMGTGEERMCELFLEDPIYEYNIVPDGVARYTINFDILVSPRLMPEKHITGFECQGIAQSIALNIISLMRRLSNRNPYPNVDIDDDFILKITDASILTLSHYSDNDCWGVRATLQFQAPTGLEFCDDSHWDNSKTLKVDKFLPHIDTDGATACKEIFADKPLPTFDF